MEISLVLRIGNTRDLGGGTMGSIRGKIVEKGGWHFGWIKKSNEIVKKLESFAHAEYDKDSIKSNDFIERCILNEINFLNTNQKLTKDKNINLPTFITENKNKFIEFLC